MKEQHEEFQISQKEYRIRPGTINFGREYEFKVASLLTLRCISEHFEDFWLASNADGTGAFDDIILQVRKTKNKTTTFMLQLKHQEVPKNVTEKDFLLNKGDFSLLKYFKDINVLHETMQSGSSEQAIIKDIGKSTDIYFVIYTNRGLNESKVLEKDCEHALALLNTSVAFSKNSYKFLNITVSNGTTLNSTNKHNNVYLLSNQVSIKKIDEEIAVTIQKILKTQLNVGSIAQHFVNYFTEWAKGTLGGHYCITKQDILYKLTDLALSDYEINLRQVLFAPYSCSQKLVWNDIVENKAITIISFSEAVKQFLIQYIGSEVVKYCKKCPKVWDENFTEKQQNSFYKENMNLKKYLLRAVGTSGKLTLLDIYKCIWRMENLPILLHIQNAHEYKKTLNILKLSNQSYKAILLVNEKKLPPLKKGGTKRFETMQDLEEENKKKILQQKLQVQERVSTLENIISTNMYSDITCADIINLLSGDFNIGEKLEPLPDYLIGRSIIKTAIKYEFLQYIHNELVLVNIKNDREIAPIHKLTATCRIEDTNLKQLQNFTGVITFQESLTAKQLEELKLLNRPIHILSVHNENYFNWTWSYGSTDNIKHFQVKLEQDLKTSTMKTFLTATNIISAEPGMGKSIVMDYLAHQTPTSKWILRIDLNKFQEYFRRSICKDSSAGAALTHLMYFYNELYRKKESNTKLAKAVFENLAKAKNVVILLDGFDEISVSYKEEVTNIAKSLTKEGYCIWITTRPVMKLYLEEAFNTRCIELKPFTINDQEQFLTKYFAATYCSFNSCSKLSIIQTFVKQLLKSARKNLQDHDAEFTGIPLQTRLLAEVFSDECRVSLCNDKVVIIDDNFDLLYLYQQFIKKKINILINKYGEAANEIYIAIKEQQSLFGLKLVFPLEDLVDRDLINKLYDSSTKMSNKIQLIAKDGVLMVDENFNVSYVHRTFGEYLAAEWLSENLNNTNEQIRSMAHILIKERFTQNYKFLFNVFDRMLVKSCPLHLSIINHQEELLQMVMDAEVDISTLADKGGRSALHIIALYGYQYPRIYDVNSNFEQISNEDKMLAMAKIISNGCMEKLSSVIDTMGYTPIDYAFANMTLGILNEIQIRTKAKMINAYVNFEYEEGYLNYCIENYPNLFKQFLYYFLLRRLLLQTIDKNMSVKQYMEQVYHYYYDWRQFLCEFNNTNVFQLFNFNNCLDLRYAVCFGSTTNVLDLLKNTGDINVPDLDKNTPLHYAVLHERSKIVEVLLSKGAKVNKGNGDHNTPLHLAVVKRNKMITKLLLSKNADVNISNINGNTSLHLAVNGYTRSPSHGIIKLLLDNNADVNAQNKTGVSVLVHAEKNGCSNAVVNLLNCKM